ncbi:Uncharacterized protein HZ326_14122 [Fusarium oxysporum f. sp. albedinis]|nr:Uncharacterized protein HZ326_14122 [Fusarium oxysporum f. sp. albedinis]
MYIINYLQFEKIFRNTKLSDEAMGAMLVGLLVGQYCMIAYELFFFFPAYPEPNSENPLTDHCFLAVIPHVNALFHFTHS